MRFFLEWRKSPYFLLFNAMPQSKHPYKIFATIIRENHKIMKRAESAEYLFITAQCNADINAEQTDQCSHKKTKSKKKINFYIT